MISYEISDRVFLLLLSFAALLSFFGGYLAGRITGWNRGHEEGFKAGMQEGWTQCYANWKARR